MNSAVLDSKTSTEICGHFSELEGWCYLEPGHDPGHLFSRVEPPKKQPVPVQERQP